jgi:hypothetical protein
MSYYGGDEPETTVYYDKGRGGRGSFESVTQDYTKSDQEKYPEAKAYFDWIEAWQYPWMPTFVSDYKSEWYGSAWRPLYVPLKDDFYKNPTKHDPFKTGSSEFKKKNPALVYVQYPAAFNKPIKTSTAALKAKTPDSGVIDTILRSIDSEWHSLRKSLVREQKEWESKGFRVVPNIFTGLFEWIFYESSKASIPSPYEQKKPRRKAAYPTHAQANGLSAGVDIASSSSYGVASLPMNAYMSCEAKCVDWIWENEVLFDIYAKDDRNHGKFIMRNGQVYEYTYTSSDKLDSLVVEPKLLSAIDSSETAVISRKKWHQDMHRRLETLNFHHVPFYRHDTGDTMYYGYDYPRVPVLIYGDDNSEPFGARELVAKIDTYLSLFS